MSKQKAPKALSGLVSYILGRHPDEFGLVPNPEGYVRIKELLKAVNEEEGWKYVRKQHLNEILYTLSAPPIEMNDNVIRATNRENAPIKTIAENLPKLLYTCVRRKAYPAILNKGVLTSVHLPLILSVNQGMAERIGTRIDTMTVLLTVQVQKSLETGVIFYQFGRSIFLGESIPADCFSGPPLPKQKAELPKEPRPGQRESQKLAGSYLIDPLDDKTSKRSRHRAKKQKEIYWKKDRKKMSRQKQKNWPV